MYAPRTIAYICELFHPPQAPDPASIQKVHNELFETGDPAYKSFSVTPTGAVLSNPTVRPGASSSATFLADRIQFREELGGATTEEFAARVLDIARRIAARTNVQVFTAQQVTLRTLVNPRSHRDSREFLKQSMFGFDRQTEVFGREPGLFGVRMVFPPTAEVPRQYALRIESFSSDPRSLFVENQASFPPVLVARGLDPLAENVRDTYAFLVERALAFVDCFDHPAES